MHSSRWEAAAESFDQVFGFRSHTVWHESCHGHHLRQEIEQVMKLLQALVTSPVEQAWLQQRPTQRASLGSRRDYVSSGAWHGGSALEMG